MKNLTYFTIFLFICSQQCSAELLGKLEGNLYTDSAKVFSTTLPSLEGKIRDQINAVSVYEKATGSQDSLEYYNVPDKFLKKYLEVGPAQYHLVSQNKLIETRYKSNFKKVDLVKQGIIKISGYDVFVSTLSIPQGSRIKNIDESKRDMIVLIGSLIVNSKLFIYQIANTMDDTIVNDSKVLNLTKKLKKWVEETEFKI